MFRILMAALAVAVAASSAQAGPAPKATPIAKGVWLIPGDIAAGREPDGATVILEGRDGLVVVDTGRHADHTQAILDFAVARARPVRVVVNTHWHLDHVSGNRRLRAAWPGLRLYASSAIEGALSGFLARSAAQADELVASGRLPPSLAEDVAADAATVRDPGSLRPDVVVAQSGPRRLAGRLVMVNLARRAATEGDVWLYDPATRTLVAGDLVTLPSPFLDTACPQGWAHALAALEATPFVRLAPGHGPVMGRADFVLWRRAYGALLDCAAGGATASACGDAWAAAVAPLLGPDPADARRARSMTEAYVANVLRGPDPAGRCGTRQAVSGGAD